MYDRPDVVQDDRKGWDWIWRHQAVVRIGLFMRLQGGVVHPALCDPDLFAGIRFFTGQKKKRNEGLCPDGTVHSGGVCRNDCPGHRITMEI